MITGKPRSLRRTPGAARTQALLERKERALRTDALPSDSAPVRVDRGPVVGPTISAGEAREASLERELFRAADAVWAELLRHEPTLATTEGHDRVHSDAQLESLAPHAWRRHFSRIERAQRAYRGAVEPLLAQLASEHKALPVELQILDDVLKAAFSHRATMKTHAPHEWELISSWDLHNTLTDNFSVYQTMNAPASSERLAQADRLIRRLGKVERLLEERCAALDRARARGLVAAPPAIASIVRQLDALLARPLAESPFLATIRDWENRERGGMASPSKDVRRRIDAAESVVDARVMPALAAYRDYLRDVLLPASTALRGERVGVGHLPGGDAYYRAELARWAETRDPTAALYEKGLAAVAELEGEIWEKARAILGGPTPPELAAALAKIDALPENQLVEGPARLAEAERLIARAREVFSAVTGVEPGPLVVEFTSSDAMAQYVHAPSDGSVPARMLVAERGGDWGTFVATIAHEYWHHLQFSAMAARTSSGTHPLTRGYRRGSTIEGGALYAERLAGAAGMYEFAGDPRRTALAQLGALRSQQLRAVRVVVDTGIHDPSLPHPAGGPWTLERMIAYGIEKTGLTQGEIELEMLRYVSHPAQATSYFLPMLEILAAKREAKARLGDASEGFSFRRIEDERAFNDLLASTSGAALATVLQAIGRL